jgi:hypothetical protein
LVVSIAAGVVVVAVIVAVAVLYRVTTSPTTYRSSTYSYSVRFPGVPTVTRGTTPGGHPRERAEWSNGAGNLITVEAADLGTTVAPSQTSVVLKNALAASVTAVSGSGVADVSTSDLDGAPARSERFTCAQLGSAWELVSVKGSTLYVVTIAHTNAAEQSGIEKTFTFSG